MEESTSNINNNSTVIRSAPAVITEKDIKEVIEIAEETIARGKENKSEEKKVNSESKPEKRKRIQNLEHSRKKVINAEQRLKINPELKDHFKAAEEALLMCKYCGVARGFSKLSVLIDHIKSESHCANMKKRNQPGKQFFQPTMDSFNKSMMSQKALEEKFQGDFVNMLATANIPAFKIEKMKPFFKTWCPQHTLPLRQKVQEIVATKSVDVQSKLKRLLVDKPISIVVDETTRSKSTNRTNEASRTNKIEFEFY